jgi:uncharacterized membrane protein YecN with MAPEG domain
MGKYEIVALYTGLMVLLFVLLKLNAGRVRVATKVDIGEGGDQRMIRAMRAQGNAVEDAPMIMLGLFALAALGAGDIMLHILGGGFVVARVLHALGLGGAKGFGVGRLIGTMATLIIGLVTAGACIWLSLT